MSDLVERLRAGWLKPECTPIEFGEAADEIKRLQALSASQQSELESIYAILKCRCEGEAVNEIEFLQAELESEKRNRRMQQELRENMLEQFVLLRNDLNRYVEREKTMGWNQT